jgi:hypothetical protein
VHFEPTGIYEAIHTKVDWWITLHIINLFGFALLGLAAYLLIAEQQGLTAKIAKILLAIFIPTYAGFDSVIGIGTGILVQYANRVPVNQLVILDPTINAFWRNNVAMMLATVGSITWGLSMTLIAVSLTEQKRRAVVLVLGLITGAITGWGASASTFGTLPWWIAVALVGLLTLLTTRLSFISALFILAGVLFGTTHVVPFGPLGMACFLIAVALLEFSPNKIQIPQANKALVSTYR